MKRKKKHILDGIRVLDFSQHVAGPGVTRTMAEMGAEIIKLELTGEKIVVNTETSEYLKRAD